ncbi:hypothetical protein Pmani_006125 [Petrolisthes manimaculis]|uniref:Uncharacterized protein n=1 Tax=Petrolisthes manimaculis TaxID=1843537 RepID=A0AAE1UGU5_9EUCA|nr:hypothetical protein Pmani_006125 [Petrolisthes manimaculis]
MRLSLFLMALLAMVAVSSAMPADEERDVAKEELDEEVEVAVMHRVRRDDSSESSESSESDEDSSSSESDESDEDKRRKRK